MSVFGRVEYHAKIFCAFSSEKERVQVCIISVKGMKDGLMQLIQALILKNLDVSIDSLVIHERHLETVEFHLIILSS